MQNINKKLFIFIALCVVVWSLVPLLRQSLPMDTQEAIVWGKYCLFGTTKHPPLSGWLAYAFYNLFGQWSGAMYLLSQLCVALGVLYIYKLARCFMDDLSATLAALLQYGIIYYHFSAVEYNVNVVSLALWPMCTYYFWQAYQKNLWKDWLLFGILVAANLWNKYVSAVLFMSLALFVITDKGIRKTLGNIKAYVACGFCLILLCPHVYWLWQNDFEPFNYIAGRSHGGNIGTPWNHVVYPLKFLLAQILFAAAAIITYLSFYIRYGRGLKSKFQTNLKQIPWLKNSKERTNALFIAVNAIAPVSIFMLMAIATGNPLKSMWGFPCLYMLGIFLFYFLPIKWNNKTEKKYIYSMAGWVFLFAIAYATQCLLTKSEKFNLNNQQLVSELQQKWTDYSNGKPLEYVAADAWFADMFSLYADSNVKPIIWANPKSNPWFDINDLINKGALIIAASEKEYNDYAKRLSGYKTQPHRFDYEIKNHFNQSKKRTLYYGFYQNKEMNND